MATVGIRELKSKTSEIIQRSLKGEIFLVTRRGKPVSVVLPLDADVEDLILSEAPRFIRLRERGREEYRRGKTIPLAAVKEELKQAPRPRSRGLARRAH